MRTRDPLATVRNLKRQTEPEELVWVETDTSDSYLPDVNLELNRWTCLPVSGPLDPPALRADVTGRTCALDVLVSDAELPSVEAGDVVAFLDTGAYQDATASNFNALGRPGTVLVRGAEAELIRRHETVEDVFGRDLIPERLDDGDSRAGGEGWRVAGIDHASVSCATSIARFTSTATCSGSRCALEARPRAPSSRSAASRIRMCAGPICSCREVTCSS